MPLRVALAASIAAAVSLRAATVACDEPGGSGRERGVCQVLGVRLNRPAAAAGAWASAAAHAPMRQPRMQERRRLRLGRVERLAGATAAPRTSAMLPRTWASVGDAGGASPCPWAGVASITNATRIAR